MDEKKELGKPHTVQVTGLSVLIPSCTCMRNGNAQSSVRNAELSPSCDLSLSSQCLWISPMLSHLGTKTSAADSTDCKVTAKNIPGCTQGAPQSKNHEVGPCVCTLHLLIAGPSTARI